ncbi:MAG: class I SAM-dependent methyltransferase [Candidatus Eisenbacteria bacterium]
MTDLEPERERCVFCRTELKRDAVAWVARCPRCALLRSRLDDPRESGARHLAEEDRESGLEPLRRANFTRLLDRLSRLVEPRGTRLLEVGCGHGWFLEAAKARGFRAEGIEPDAPVAARARARGAEVREGLFPDCLRENEAWDVLVMNDVFEHLPDPPAALAACARHLSANGLLVINLPTSSGAVYRIGALLARLGVSSVFDRLWQRGYPSPHLFYFTASNLDRMAEGAGFGLAAGGTLPSIELRGLWARLRMDRTHSWAGAAAAYLGLSAAYPFLRWLLPSDIALRVYRREEKLALVQTPPAG